MGTNTKILLLALLAATQVASLVLANPATRRSSRQISRLPRAYVQSAPATPCHDAGHSTGCCETSNTEDCFIHISNCFCDESCYEFEDCCADIIDIGCSNQDETTCAELPPLENGMITYEPQSSSSQKPFRTVATYSCNEGYVLSGDPERVCQQGVSGDSLVWSGDGQQQCLGQTCSEAGLSNGCCSWDNGGSCYVPEGRCYCDPLCSDPANDDCCHDVDTSQTCTPINSFKAVSQLYTGHKDVRMKLSSQTQKASRPRDNGQNQNSGKSEAIRELASELRVMSKAQELSNEEYRAQWKRVLSELENIQKTKENNDY